MWRWGTVVVLAFAVVAARSYNRAPASRPIRAAKAPVDDTAVARGHLVYERYGCSMCHGPEGKGGFANPNAETDGKVPSIVYVAEGYKPSEVAQVIRAGRPRVGRADPKGAVPPYRMPGWGDRLSEQEIDDLVSYLMSLYPKDAKKKGWG